MKKIFIPAKSTFEISLGSVENISSKLPKKFSLVYSVQYQEQAKQLKYLLSKNHEITDFLQVLGCSRPKIANSSQAILLMGEGMFHASALALNMEKPVFLFEKSKFVKINDKDVEKLTKKKKIAMLRYLHAKKVGAIISSKPGQQKLEAILNFKKVSKKKIYLFITDSIDIGEFENFQIDSWVNTACPKMNLDFSFVNLEDLDISN